MEKKIKDVNSDNNLQHVDMLYNNIKKINHKIKKYFNLFRINHTVILINKGVDTMLFMASDLPDFSFDPIIFLIKDENFNYPKKMDSLFPTKDFLINLFSVVNITFYKEDEIYESKKNINELLEMSEGIQKIWFEFLITNKNIIYELNEDLQYMKNKICEVFQEYIKEMDDIESENIFDKEKLIKETYFKKLNIFKTDLFNFDIKTINSLSNFIKENIKFEPDLFLEIFTDEMYKKETDEINFLRQNYIFHARKIKEEYEKIDNTRSIYIKIDNFLKKYNFGI